MKEVKVGMRFGHLEVIEPREQGKKRKSWLCLCDCGNYVVKGSTRLLGVDNRRPDKSCGCEKKALGGLLKTDVEKRIYGTWYLMNKRCYDEKADNYERYGGKGVTVCDEWREDFKTFYQWAITNGYKNNLTIDRIDPSKPYSPDNCRWADYYLQSQNKGVMKNNKSGITGVSKYKYGYRANISREYITLNLGTYQNLEDAKNARLKAEKYYKEHGTLKGYKLNLS